MKLMERGATYDYGFRIYDSRVGKFLSVDPLRKSYPMYTPYQFAGNEPIAAIDMDGLEPKTMIDETGKLTRPMVTLLVYAFGYDEIGVMRNDWMYAGASIEGTVTFAWVKAFDKIDPSAVTNLLGTFFSSEMLIEKSERRWFVLVAHEHSHWNDNVTGSDDFKLTTDEYLGRSGEVKAYGISALARRLFDEFDVVGVLNNQNLSEVEKQYEMKKIGIQFNVKLTQENIVKVDNEISLNEQAIKNTTTMKDSKQKTKLLDNLNSKKQNLEIKKIDLMIKEAELESNLDSMGK